MFLVNVFIQCAVVVLLVVFTGLWNKIFWVFVSWKRLQRVQQCTSFR